MSKNTLYISRKRKKWKYWHFDQFKNCLHLADANPKKISDFLEGEGPVVLEIGAGTANLSLEFARRNPNARIIAVDLKSDRLYSGAKFALQEELTNLVFLRGHVQQLREVLKEGSVDLIWVTFPDPFLKDRQEKHRLTEPKFLSLYAFLLNDSGILKFKTDNLALFNWSLEQLKDSNWKVLSLTHDLHEEFLENYTNTNVVLGDDLLLTPLEKVKTKYEEKFTAAGIKINYLEAQPPKKE